MTRNTRFFVAGAAALLALTLAGCSTSATDSVDMPAISGGSSGADVAIDPGMGNQTTKESSVGSSVGTSAMPSYGIGGASTITSTWLSLTTTNPVGTADEAAVIADAAGGYVENRSESTGGGVVVPLSGVEGDVTLGGTGPTDYVSLTLRVPTEKADAVIGDLKELGRVSSFNQSQYDVGQQQADLAARITSLTESLASLRGLQASAANVSDLLAAEAAISARQSELDSLIAQRDYFDSQIDMTSISVDVTSTSVGSASDLTFLDGIVNGWNSIGTALSLVGVAIGFLLPWLGVFIVLAGIAAAIAIPVVRRTRARAAAQAKPVEAKPVEAKRVARKPAPRARKPQPKK
jgi:hypothetical protein